MNEGTLEKLKKQKLEDFIWLFGLSKSQKEALTVTHHCETGYDLVNLFNRRVCGIKGFSEKNFVKLKRDVLHRIQGKVCCYENKYIKVYHDRYSQYTGENNITVYVENSYPVDDALSVSFDKSDVWGRKLKEGQQDFNYVKNGKVLVMVKIDLIDRTEIVLRFLEGEQLLNTDFYAVDCKIETIREDLKEKEKVPEKVEHPKNEKKERSVINDDSDDKRIKSIIYLQDVGILSEKECADIVSYLKGEADIFTIEDFSDEDLDVDFDEEM